MMENRIVYDLDELKIRLEQNLDTLDRIRFNEKYAKALGQDFVHQVDHWAGSIRRQKDLPFTIVVCGEFKRGKSSMINALLGEDVVVTDITPETITINRISYGEHSNALVFPGGKRMLLHDDQLCREKLEPLLEEQKEGVYQLEIKRPLEFLRNITIVDTPGMEDSMQDYSPMVIEAINQADAVMYVFSVNYPISRREQLFIKNVLLPQKHTDMMLIGNFADTLGKPESYARMRSSIEQRLEMILPGIPLYMVSALDERCCQLETARPAKKLNSVLEDEFKSLRERLAKLIADKCDMVLPDRMERMFRSMMTDLNAKLNVLEHGVTVAKENLRQERQRQEENCDALQKKLHQTLEKISQDIEKMRQEAEIWIFDLISSMREETKSMEDMDTLDIRKYYSIYCSDTLQDALMRCVDHHLEQLYDEMDGISEQLEQTISIDVSQMPKQNFRFALNNKTWTKGDNVYLGTSSVGLGGILSLVSMAIAGHMREKELSSKKDTVLDDIFKQYIQLEKTIPSVLKRCYDQIETELNDQVQAFFNDQMDQMSANTERIVEIANRTEDEKQLVLQTIAQVRALLESTAM